MDLDLEELIALVELLDRFEFTEFRYEKGDLRLYVRRGDPVGPEGQGADDAGEAHRGAEQPAVRTGTPATQPKAVPDHTAESRPEDEQTVLVTAPLLGNFYRAPKPGEPALVVIGDKVEPETVVCIVEVMKLMNSVPAGVTGEITAVHVQDGDLVEFGQPLFSVRPIPSQIP